MPIHKIKTFALAIVFSAGLVGGCTVALDSHQEAKFQCETDKDCIEGYECDPANKVCRESDFVSDKAPACDQDPATAPEGDIDLDNDGYGTGGDRSNCPKPQADCDDTDPSRHPDNAEVCDGLDNDCDAAVDDLECTGDLDCGFFTANSSVTYDCVENKCVLKSNFTSEPPCSEIAATCNSAKKAFVYTVDGTSYDLIKGGELNGPIAACGS